MESNEASKENGKINSDPKEIHCTINKYLNLVQNFI